MVIKPWTEISREVFFQKYGRKIDKVIFKLPDGSESDFYLTGQNGRVVCVLALTPQNEVILVKQFRPGPQKILLDLPGGAANQDETPLEAISRELLEETGYAGNLEFVTKSIVDAYSGATRFHFVAKNCDKVQEIFNSNTEITEVELMTIDSFKKHLRTGQLCDVDTGYYGLDYLKLL